MKKTHHKLAICVLLVMFLGTSCLAQDVVGRWHTVDDHTNEVKSTVEIFLRQGQVFGKVIAITDPTQQDATCTECDSDDPRKNQPIIGMEIIKGLKKSGKVWIGGEILDPENGNVYKCKIWRENEALIVRGYLGFSLLGRSQTWFKTP